ncbi:MAG TPA: 4Fe-4S binding protein, partial [Phenylobacterium sp.]|uniref:4Fe-4S binding protein n=1 Tax=Phenylobacterium sp. TaxID=1871053 RepID=UPI002B486C64
MSRPRDLSRAAEAEFPAAFEGLTDTGRRQMLKAIGASLGLAGLAGCTSDQPDAQALPYVRQPEYLVPDRARHYATAVTPVCGYAQPVLGTTHMGRPTKLEGLPGHPAAQGAADAFTQASILGLYDPDRSQIPRRRGVPTDWGALDAAMIDSARTLDARQGEGLRILTGQLTSPTFARQIAEITTRWPKSRWHVLEPAGDASRREAARLAFGRPLDLLPRLDRAAVVVSLDDDLLGPGPQQVRNARLWSQRRQAFQRGSAPSRLFCAEPTPSLTGVAAQDRLAVAHARVPLLCQALAAAFGLAPAPQGLSAREQGWTRAAAAALVAAHGAALVTVGVQHPAEVQALAWRIDQALGAFGATLDARPPAALEPPDGARSFEVLCADMAAGAVDILMILEANPLYAAPADIDFARALRKVRLTVHGGLHLDETARGCAWHAPLEHELETWSDARSVDGNVSLIQPLVRPFYAVRSRHVLLETLQGRPDSIGRDIVAATWRAAWGEAFDERWAESLRQGWVADSAVAPVAASPASLPVRAAAPAVDDALELVFRADPSVWDGRFAGNGALQELPKPLNKITWGNALAISASLAAELRVRNGDVIRVSAGARTVEGPVWITPGQARRTITAPLGYGRHLPGQLGDGIGFDAFRLRISGAPWAIASVAVAPTGRSTRLATTQLQQAQGDHDMAPSISSEAARQPKCPRGKPLSFYPDQPQEGPQYGMSIDTDLCIGCNACVSACDMENNVAIVGEEQVRLGREMHWLRIDHYADGDPEAPVE